MFFSLALFVLVFALSCVVKIQAASNMTGWLWGGSEDANLGGVENCLTYPAAPGCVDGDETGVGWISLTNKNLDPDGSIPYSVTINDAGKASGYAWTNAGGNPDNGFQNGLGWVDFNPQDHCVADLDGALDDLSSSGRYEAKNCNPDGGGSPGVFRSGNSLVGWVRFVEIAKASVSGNSGGWSGWIRLNGATYGVVINADNTLSGYGWNGETDLSPTDGNMAEGLGWINFSGAKLEEIIMPQCGSAQAPRCPDQGAPASNLCSPGTDSGVSGGGPWNWICTEGTNTVPCTSLVRPPMNGQCGTADGSSFCQAREVNVADLCSSGESDPSVSDFNDLLDSGNLENKYEVTWKCKGVCGGVDASCSAGGRKSCGWIETNP